MLAGTLELTIGHAIRSAVGNKTDMTGLELLTIVLSLTAVVAAWNAVRHPQLSRARRFAVVFLLLIPAGIYFTTVGALWWIPGPLLLVSGLVIARGAMGRRG